MSIADNIKSVRERIAKAAQMANRDISEITLIGVSKTKPVDMIKEAIDCGILDLGENKPQELAEKYPQISEDARWHLIGNLQKNKVRHIIDKAYLIHSVDSLELALEINKRAAAADKVQDILIQVNITGEQTKSGVVPDEAAELCKKISELENIRIKGLMTISARDYTYDQNKEVFRRLKELSLKIDSLCIENVSMRELSMGMTHDFEAAIEAGATLIRVGAAIFGERDYRV